MSDKRGKFDQHLIAGLMAAGASLSIGSKVWDCAFATTVPARIRDVNR
jgi:hypothetical protein